LKIDDQSTTKKVYFTPTEIGVHYLNAKFGSDIVPGKMKLISNFNHTFNKGTPIKMLVINTNLITAYGDGIHHALHEKLAIFMIDTKDVQGDLKVRIEGKINFKTKTLLFHSSRS
jgi:hypothetical protein